MSWTIAVGGSIPLEVGSEESVQAAVALAHATAGLPMAVAQRYGRDAKERLNRYREARRMRWDTPPLTFIQVLDNGLRLEIQSTDLPEQSGTYCNGYTSAGNRCGRSMNHQGEC
jgi:hypothetical protein